MTLIVKFINNRLKTSDYNFYACCDQSCRRLLFRL